MREIVGARRGKVGRWAVRLAAIALVLGTSKVASAIEIPVNSQCTLMEALISARTHSAPPGCVAGTGNDTIKLPAGTINLSSTEAMEIYGNQVVIQGAGMYNTTIVTSSVAAPSSSTGLTLDDCNGRDSAVYISASATVTFNDLTLKGTTGVDNQGICLSAGQLFLNRTRITTFRVRGIFARFSESSLGSFIDLQIDSCLFDNNHAYDDGSGGAAIYFGDVTGPSSMSIKNSTISNNVSDGIGGGVTIVGDQQGGPTIAATTISGNSAGSYGGGLYLDRPSYVELDYVTLSFNHAGAIGGGIFKFTATGNLLLGSSIVTNNSATSDAQQANLNVPLDGDHNSITCNTSLIYVTGSEWNANNQPIQGGNPCEYTTADAHLAALQGRGGPNNLPLHVPAAGSHAIDRFDAVDPTYDQRGAVRPADGDGNGVKRYDRGAYEIHPQQFETEGLAVAAKSNNVAHAIVSSDSKYSANGGTHLSSTAVGHFVTYQTPSLATGTYKMVLRFKTDTSLGRFQVSIANTLSGTYSPFVGEQQGYSENPSFTTSTITTNYVVSSAGQKFVKLAITGKTGSGYGLFPDYIDFIKN